MPAEWDTWDWDYVWHALGGLGINGVVVGLMAWLNGPWWVAFTTVTLCLAGGVIRELSQHKWSFSEMTAHRWLEGVLWGAGALVAACVGLFF